MHPILCFPLLVCLIVPALPVVAQEPRIAPVSASAPLTPEGDRVSYRRLTWADFRIDDKAPGMAAQTHTFISFSFRAQTIKRGDTFISTATEVTFDGGFDRQRSWRRSTVNTKSDLLLLHEQGHFDIAELKRRQLTRWKVSELPVGRATTASASYDSLKKQLQTLYRDAMRDLEDTQRRYDEETAHGVQRDVQQQWTERLRNALAILTAPAAP